MNEVEHRAQKIKPVVAFDFYEPSGLELYSRFAKGGKIVPLYDKASYTQSANGYLCYIEPVDLWKEAYTWDPRPAQFAMDISPYEYFIAQSRYGAPSFFKPSIGEVLNCLPDHLVEKTIAFEINPYDKSVWHCSIDGYHTFLVRVFQDRAKREEERYRSMDEHQ